MVRYSAIVICDQSYGIADSYGKIPFHVDSDLKEEDMCVFKNYTNRKVVIMGSTTYKSLTSPDGLHNRVNVVLTNEDKDFDNSAPELNKTYYFNSIDAIDHWLTNNNVKSAIVIGGAQIYKMYINRNLISEFVMVNPIKDVYRATTVFVPEFKTLIKNASTSRYGPIQHVFVGQYTINTEELNMLNLMKSILYAPIAKCRSAISTRSIFGAQLKFDLSGNKFPRMTTNPTYFKGLFYELMMVLNGYTDTKYLTDKNINIWKVHTSREYLNSRKLNHYPVGCMGQSYGHSMRHFGDTNYAPSDYTTERKSTGYDQLNTLINSIKNDPSSRRHIINLWEPNYFDKAALPPCVFCFQFNVDEHKNIICIMTQRSSDIYTAGFWNVEYGCLFTKLVAYYTNTNATTFIWNPANIHIYENLVDLVKEQIKRIPNEYPTMSFQNMPEFITEVELHNIQFSDFTHYPAIKRIVNE